MTKIVYTIELRNADGTRASLSTPELEFPETPSAMLVESVKHNVADLSRSHTAMMHAIKSAIDGTAVRANGHGKNPNIAAVRR